MSDIIRDGTYVTIISPAISDPGEYRQNKEENIKNLNIKNRIKQLEEIKKGLRLNGKIDDKKLNEIFSSLEREILGTEGFFGYNFDAKNKTYRLTYKGITLDIPIKSQEKLIDTANYIDSIIDQYIFKGQKEKFYSGRDRFNSDITTINKKSGFFKKIDFFDLRIDSGEKIRSVTGNKNERIIKANGEIFSASEELSKFLNAIIEDNL